MSDPGAIGKDAPIEGTLTRPRTGGYLEQWQRELEAAYQRYVAAARSTGRGQAESEPPQPDTGLYIEESISAVWSRRDAGPSLSVSPARAAGTVPPPPDVIPGTRAGVDAVLRSDPYGLRLGGSPPRARPAPAPPPERPGSPKPALPSPLPEASSVRLLQAGGRLHLVVRDVALEPDTLLRLVSRIRTGLDAAMRRLAAITLNGERIWRSDEDDSFRPAADVDRAVDRHF